MWKTPTLVLDAQVEIIQLWLEANQIDIQKPYPAGHWGFVEDSVQGHQYFKKMHKDLRELVQKAKEEGKDLRTVLKEYLLRLARAIERNGSYQVFNALNGAFDELRVDNENYAILPNTINSTLQTLVGNEGKLLFGTRGGKPAWKTLSTPFTRTLPPLSSLYSYPAQEMAYLDQSDEDLMPEPSEWTTALPIAYDWPKIDISQVRQLMEQAYYNQRYTVQPEGAHVKLRHFGPIKRVVLKVKSPSLHDLNYFDLVVQFEVDNQSLHRIPRGHPPGLVKRSLLVFDGICMVGDGLFFHADEREERGITYLAWVAALIYHDLVTADVITGERKVVSHDTQLVVAEDEEEKPSWVYIPRKVKKHRASPRIPSDNPQVITPHRVSGHLRRANPTESHLKTLAEFERKTGLRIIDLLSRNPNHTFVRPHISPSEEGVKDLPKFIHSRLQSDMEKLMQGTEEGRK